MTTTALPCSVEQIAVIEAKKRDLINCLIGSSMQYRTIGHLSAAMNIAILEIKEANGIV
jgi:hypothetical protein